jgi:ATP-binding cassette subfamily F protein 3
MRHALTWALQDYAGALIIVSHDRHLLRTTTDAFVLVDAGRVEPFTGDLDDYRNWLNERQNSVKGGSARSNGGSAAERREQKRLEAERRNRLAAKRRPLEQRGRALEERLDRLSQSKQDIETALAEPDIYEDANKHRLKELLLRQGKVDQKLEQVEEEWLEVQEALETLDLED